MGRYGRIWGAGENRSIFDPSTLDEHVKFSDINKMAEEMYAYIGLWEHLGILIPKCTCLFWTSHMHPSSDSTHSCLAQRDEDV